MVRCHQHIAPVGISGHEPLGRPALEVARQEPAAAGCLDRHHEARLVVGAAGSSRHACRRMEHANPTLRIDGERVARPHDSHGNPAVLKGRDEFAGGRGIARQQGLRGHHLTDDKPVEQFGHRVEVIDVGMRDHEVVDRPRPLAPEHGRQRP